MHLKYYWFFEQKRKKTKTCFVDDCELNDVKCYLQQFFKSSRRRIEWDIHNALTELFNLKFQATCADIHISYAILSTCERNNNNLFINHFFLLEAVMMRLLSPIVFPLHIAIFNDNAIEIDEDKFISMDYRTTNRFSIHSCETDYITFCNITDKLTISVDFCTNMIREFLLHLCISLFAFRSDTIGKKLWNVCRCQNTFMQVLAFWFVNLRYTSFFSADAKT